MNPKEYLMLERELSAVMRLCGDRIAAARKQADKAKPPHREEIRRATPNDIKVGTIIWNEKGDNGWFWNVVEEVHYPNDPFKAYTADDGCRYGLDGAWVYASPHPKKPQAAKPAKYK